MLGNVELVERFPTAFLTKFQGLLLASCIRGDIDKGTTMKARRVGLLSLVACFHPVYSVAHRSPVWVARAPIRPHTANNNCGLVEEEETRALLREIMGLERASLSLPLSLSLPMLSLSLPMLSLSLPVRPFREIELPPETASTAPSLREPTGPPMTRNPSKRVVIPPSMAPTSQDQGESAPKALGSVGKSSGSSTRPAAVAGFAILAIVVVVAAAFYLFHRRTSHMAAAASCGSVASGPDENSVVGSHEGAV